MKRLISFSPIVKEFRTNSISQSIYQIRRQIYEGMRRRKSATKAVVHHTTDTSPRLPQQEEQAVEDEGEGEGQIYLAPETLVFP